MIVQSTRDNDESTLQQLWCVQQSSKNYTKWEIFKKIDERNCQKNKSSQKIKETKVSRFFTLPKIREMKICFRHPRKLNSTRRDEKIDNMFKSVSCKFKS